jgi:aryl-alcohol dehydrogenase-like predicted oxidoreductase
MRTLGKTGIQAHPLGLAASYGIDAKSIERAFHELGIQYFFVTPRMGAMVEAVRNLVKAGHRDRLVLATGANVPFGFTVRREFDHARKVFGVDAFDVFQMIWVQGHWYVAGGSWREMRSIKESGQAKALGISCHDRPMARALVDELDLDLLMIRYNAAHRGAEREVFATLDADATKRPAIVAYTATRWGKLLAPVGGEGPMTPGECYRFALGEPRVDVVLSGAASWDELRQNADAVALGPLSPERLEQVRRFGDRVRATATGRLGFLGA